MKKDFLGQELKVGDRVIFMELNYRKLLIGEVIRFNGDTQVTVAYPARYWKGGRLTERRQRLNQVVRYNESTG